MFIFLIHIYKPPTNVTGQTISRDVLEPAIMESIFWLSHLFLSIFVLSARPGSLFVQTTSKAVFKEYVFRVPFYSSTYWYSKHKG